MNLDDDEKTPAPAPSVPAGDQPEVSDQPEAEEAEGEEAETETLEDDDEGDDDEQDEDEDEDGDDEDKPKRKSGSRAARYKRRAEAAEARLQDMRSRSNGSLPADVSSEAALNRHIAQRVYNEIGDPPNPQDPRWKDNYVGFERAAQAYETDLRQVERSVRKEMHADYTRERERMGQLVADHKERIAKLRTKVKDFDVIMARATVPVHPHVERLILESKRSERISLVLAKDQSRLVKLNNMSPEAAAREIGRIEGRLSLPQPKQQTQARKPVAPLRGGGAGPRSGLAEVNAYMKRRYGDRD